MRFGFNNSRIPISEGFFVCLGWNFFTIYDLNTFLYTLIYKIRENEKYK